MPLTDFFSHKIFSSEVEWADRLCAIASIFHKYDGECFESCRKKLTQEFAQIAPRFSLGRKNTPWRDELTAYVSHLGVARFHRTEYGAWVIAPTKAARKFLLGEAPDVAAFLRMQLPLFQFPNAMGVQHKGKGWVMHNTLNKTWGFVQMGMQVSPVRLIAAALKADASLRDVELFQAKTEAKELYALANHRAIYCHVLPPEDAVYGVLEQIRAGKVAPPPKFEVRFHLLDHMQVFDTDGKDIRFRRTMGDADAQLLRSHFNAIATCDAYFTEFDNCQSKEELQEKILSGSWGQYFDALNHFSGEAMMSLGKDVSTESTEFIETLRGDKQKEGGLPPLRDFSRNVRPYTQEGKDNPAQVIADPEITRIKKERRNVAHALMVSRLAEWLQDNVGIQCVGDSLHIDLWAKLPNGRTFIFEVKSGGEGVWEQIRKGVSQLYEYRYRYAREMDQFKDAHLCLVLPGDPPVDWMPDYLCRDRDINLCIFPMADDIAPPNFHRFSKKALRASR